MLIIKPARAIFASAAEPIPDTPSIRSVETISETTLRINLPFASMAKSILIYRADTETGTYDYLATVNSPGVSYDDTTLSADTVRWYKIISTNGAMVSDPSAAMSGVTAHSSSSMLVRTNIREAIKRGLLSIQKGVACGNYTFKSTVYEVCDPPKAPNEFKELVAINLFFGDERSVESALMVQGDNRGMYQMSVDMTLDCFLNSNDEPSLTQEKILADTIAYFGKNYHIPDQYGNATVFQVLYESSSPFGMKIQNPDCGVTINFKVWYRMVRLDPTKLI